MNWDLIQIILILWLIERVSIERNRYKLTIDTSGQFLKEGYWAIWIYHKGINETLWTRSGGKRLIHFKKFIIPKIG
jgi:hypothetical protein